MYKRQVYATSSIYSGNADPRDRDLEGINFVEIPWLLGANPELKNACLLYTSDAADERSSVDLGGRRIIKKKNKTIEKKKTKQKNISRQTLTPDKQPDHKTTSRHHT